MRSLSFLGAGAGGRACLAIHAVLPIVFSPPNGAVPEMSLEGMFRAEDTRSTPRETGLSATIPLLAPAPTCAKALVTVEGS